MNIFRRRIYSTNSGSVFQTVYRVQTDATMHSRVHILVLANPKESESFRTYIYSKLINYKLMFIVITAILFAAINTSDYMNSFRMALIGALVGYVIALIAEHLLQDNLRRNLSSFLHIILDGRINTGIKGIDSIFSAIELEGNEYQRVAYNLVRRLDDVAELVASGSVPQKTYAHILESAIPILDKIRSADLQRISPEVRENLQNEIMRDAHKITHELDSALSNGTNHTNHLG